MMSRSDLACHKHSIYIFPSENSRTLDPRIREPQAFSDSQMFSRILWDENAIRFTLSDVENCQILRCKSNSIVTFERNVVSQK